MIVGADVLNFGADNRGLVDSTQSFNDALQAHEVVYVPIGTYLIQGTVTIPQGRSLVSIGSHGRYFLNQTIDEGAVLIKTNAGSIIRLSSNSSLQGLNLRHESGDAPNGIIYIPGSEITTYSHISKVSILGFRNNCIGIYAESNPNTSTVTFFNSFTDLVITECNTGIWLGNLCNANNFANIITRECEIHYHLNGETGSCIENIFNTIGCYSIGVINPTPVCFKLDNARRNIFSPYITEAIGKEFEIGANCSVNCFDGISNESIPSSAIGQIDKRFQSPINSSEISNMVLLDADDTSFFPGVSFKKLFQCEGDMPTQNNNSGILDTSTNCKVICKLPNKFNSLSLASFIGEITVFAYGNFGNGVGIVNSKFSCFLRNQVTGFREFKLIESNVMGDEITGLYFIDRSDEPAIAIVCGNYSNVPIVNIRAELNFTIMSHLSNKSLLSSYNDVDIVTQDVTANDIANAQSLI